MDLHEFDFNDIEKIKSFGFKGFKSINSLIIDNSTIPKQKGVYLIIRNDKKAPDFSIEGTGGFFKGKDPNISSEELQENWISDCKVIYVGKAGGENKKATLQTRLKQYLKFGQGKNIGHYGGRMIWQLSDAQDLIVCWKELPNDEPSFVEGKLINIFKEKYGKRPFANLVG